MNSNVINLPHNVENVQDLHVYSEDILDIEGGPEDDRIFQVYFTRAQTIFNENWLWVEQKITSCLIYCQIDTKKHF